MLGLDVSRQKSGWYGFLFSQIRGILHGRLPVGSVVILSLVSTLLQQTELCELRGFSWVCDPIRLPSFFKHPKNEWFLAPRIICK